MSKRGTHAIPHFLAPLSVKLESMRRLHSTSKKPNQLGVQQPRVAAWAGQEAARGDEPVRRCGVGTRRRGRAARAGVVLAVPIDRIRFSGPKPGM